MGSDAALAAAGRRIGNGLEIAHIGYLVDDVERAAHAFAASYGAGPFLYWRDTHSSDFASVTFGGAPVVYTKSMAYGVFGSTTLELMHFSLETPLTPAADDFFISRGQTFHHLAYLHPDPAADAERLRSLGMPTIGAIEDNESSAYYVDARATTGGFLELYTDREAERDLAAYVNELAHEWDGTDVLRQPPTDLN